jgi:hypothetical protein
VTNTENSFEILKHTKRKANRQSNEKARKSQAAGFKIQLTMMQL